MDNAAHLGLTAIFCGHAASQARVHADIHFNYTPIRFICQVNLSFLGSSSEKIVSFHLFYAPMASDLGEMQINFLKFNI